MEYNISHNGTEGFYNRTSLPEYQGIIPIGVFLMITITLLICLWGLVGNGGTIWLLGFRIKRNNFSTYFLHLSIADFGVLIGLSAIDVYWLIAKVNHIEYGDPLKTLFRGLFLFTYSTGLCILTAISIDRCTAVFFPLWYRIHRSRKLSTIVCNVIWVFNFLFSSLHVILLLKTGYYLLRFYQFLLNALILTPLMTISTLALSLKACSLSPHHKQGKLWLTILLTLLFFLFFAFPMNAIQYLSLYYPQFDNPYVYEYAYICSSLNSTINPLIYFLVGRDKRRTSRMTIKVIFEKVFKEEESHGENLETSVTTKSDIKRNPFTVLILNLAIADFSFLLFMAIHCINYFADFIPSGIPCVLFISISDIMYISGLLLLVAISIDRCVAVLFPIWHRCSRPKHLSPAVCAFLWICSFLLGGIPNIVEYVLEYNANLYPHLLMTTVICIPLITASTVILLVKIVLKPKQNKRGRLLVMILITLLCFLIFTVPLDIYLFIINVLDKNYFSQFPLLDKCFELGACLNSSINQI
ncbi:Proto-oncogene Mas, partial [Ophiophagus hannah]